MCSTQFPYLQGVVVEMGYPSWDQGFFEQAGSPNTGAPMCCEEVISNLKLPMILSYLGGAVLAQRRLEYETTREDVPSIARSLSHHILMYSHHNPRYTDCVLTFWHLCYVVLGQGGGKAWVKRSLTLSLR